MLTNYISRLAVLSALTLPLIFGQNDASRVVGTVTDASGAAVPKAAITLSNEKTGLERKAVADSAGYFILPNVAPSTYKMTVQANGFGQWETTAMPLSVGQERTVNVVLQPASVSSSVTVSGGDLSMVETSSAAVSANINSREVATLPLNGRQLSQLYLLAPGAQTAGGGSIDNKMLFVTMALKRVRLSMLRPAT